MDHDDNGTTAVLDEPEVQEVSSETVEETPAEKNPAELPDHVREHYNAIREKEREVYALETEYLALKEQSSEAKKEFEAADKALRNLIARGADPQRTLPFDKPAAELRKPKRIKLLVDVDDEHKAGSEYEALVDEDGDVSIATDDGEPLLLVAEDFEVIEWTYPPAPAAENDAWRKALLSELRLTTKQLDLFASAGVGTIGDLEDLRAKIADGKAEWPKGIGPGKVTEIENRVIEWLTANRDKFGEPAQQELPLETSDDQAELHGDVGKALADAGILATEEPQAKSNGKHKPKRRAFAGRPAPKTKGKKRR